MDHERGAGRRPTGRGRGVLLLPHHRCTGLGDLGRKTQTTTYDAWGRTLTLSDGNGNTGTTSYDAAGRVKTLDDGKGTYTYTYDGTDAAGKIERRGLLTQVDVGLGSAPSVFKAAADADGQTTLTVYPNGLQAVSTYDAAGAQTDLDYRTADGTEVVGFSNTVDSDGRVRRAASTASTQDYT